MARITITGANGFLGSEIVRQAVDAGHRVTAFVLVSTSVERLEGLDVKVVFGDVTRSESLSEVMTGAEFCIHTAGDTSFFLTDRARLEAVNVSGVRNVVRAARAAGVRRLVHTSSVAAVGYGANGRPVDETAQWNWPDGLPYMETKRDGERIALSAADGSFEVVSLNPVTILGSGELNPNDDQLIRALVAGRLYAMPSGGMTVCDVEDVAGAHLAALERGQSGQRYILGGPHVTHRELITRLAEAFGAAAPSIVLPDWMIGAVGTVLALMERAGFAGPAPAGALHLSTMHVYHASDKAVRELGYRMRSVEEIVKRTVAFRNAQCSGTHWRCVPLR